MAKFNLNEYETVDERIQRFYRDNANGRIETELLDQLVEDDLSKFVSDKNELMRFSSKKEIRDTVNNLISQLKCFESSIDSLPANKPKPIRIDTTKNIDTTKK